MQESSKEISEADEVKEKIAPETMQEPAPCRSRRLKNQPDIRPPQPLAPLTGGSSKNKRKNAPVTDEEHEHEEPRKRVTHRFQTRPSEDDDDLANRAGSFADYSIYSIANDRHQIQNGDISPAATRQSRRPLSDSEVAEEIKVETASDEEDLGHDRRATPPPHSVYGGEFESDEDDEASGHISHPTIFRPNRPRYNPWPATPQQVETSGTRDSGDSPMRSTGASSPALGDRDRDEGGEIRLNEEDGRARDEIEPGYDYFDEENRPVTPVTTYTISPNSPIYRPLSAELLERRDRMAQQEEEAEAAHYDLGVSALHDEEALEIRSSPRFALSSSLTAELIRRREKSGWAHTPASPVE